MGIILFMIACVASAAILLVFRDLKQVLDLSQYPPLVGLWMNVAVYGGIGVGLYMLKGWAEAPGERKNKNDLGKDGTKMT